jgi:hypothetical protein
MGRPIGSLNRQKPFADALRTEICAGNDPCHLRAIATKLIEMAEGGDLQAIKEIGDRLDGRCAQVMEHGDVPLEKMTDLQLMAISRGEPFAHINETNRTQSAACSEITRAWLRGGSIRCDWISARAPRSNCHSISKTYWCRKQDSNL